MKQTILDFTTSHRLLRLLVILLGSITLMLAAAGCASSDPEGVRISRPWYSTEVEPVKDPATDNLS